MELYCIINNACLQDCEVFCAQGQAQRPEVRIVTWKNEELTRDALPIYGFEHYKAKDYVLAHAPFSGKAKNFSLALDILFHTMILIISQLR